MRLAEIILAWLAYFSLHSLLATNRIKAWIGSRWPRLMRGYRVAFNALATLTLLPVLWLVYARESPWLWQWQGAWAGVANGMAVVAIICFITSARAYGMDEFLGLRQIRSHSDNVPTTFTVSYLHRFVRHPWYCISLALLWTRDMNESLLVSALAITAYLVVGSMLEERKLIANFGNAYQQYREAVPALIPLPWKYLSVEAAVALMKRFD